MWIKGGEKPAFVFVTSQPTQQGGKWALWSRLVPMGYQASAKVESDARLASEYRKQLKKSGWQQHATDIYYFPRAARDMFLTLAPIFLEHQVYFSNAVGTLMSLISKKKGVPIAPIRGKSLWIQDDRMEWERYLPKSGDFHYYHPFKLSRFDARNKAEAERVCRFLRSHEA